MGIKQKFRRVRWSILVLSLSVQLPIFGQETTVFPWAQLILQADQAVMRHDWSRVRECIRALLAEHVENHVEEQRYAGLLIDLARAEKELGNLKDARTILMNLSYDVLNRTQQLEATLLLARICNDLGNQTQAFGILRLLEKNHSKDLWSRQDRFFYAQLTARLDNMYESRLVRAERSFDAGLYLEAVPIYRSVLQAVEQHEFPRLIDAAVRPEAMARLRYRIAEALYQLGHNEEAIALLKLIDRCDEGVATRAPYLLGHAHRRLGNYQAAIECFKQFLSHSHTRTSDTEDAEWQIGLACYRLEQHDDAIAYFTRLAEKGKQPRLAALAQVYIARIDIDRHEIARAESRLHNLALHLASDDSLQYEIAYLRGQGARAKSDHATALRFLERSLPRRNQERAPWYAEALYSLGCSSLELATSCYGPQKEALLSRADDHFHRLMTHNRDERAFLGMARTRLLLAQIDHRMERLAAVRVILTAPENFTSDEGHAEALLLLAESMDEPQEQEKLLGQLTSAQYSGTQAQGRGWFALGILRLEQVDTGNAQLAEVIDAFGQAADLMDAHHPDLAIKARMEQIRALYREGSTISLQRGLNFVNQLLADKTPSYGIDHAAELYYTQGVIASALQEIARSEEALRLVVEHYPNSPYAPAALNVLGTTAFHQGDYTYAEELYCSLATRYPKSELAGEAWFWAAQSADWQRDRDEKVQQYRRRVYTDYPNCSFAAEAYFRLYPFAHYVNRVSEAMDHLDQMETRFPDSPFLAVAHYLRGLALKQSLDEGEEASALFEAFQNAVLHIDNCFQLGKIQEQNLEYLIQIRYRSQLESGLTYLSLGLEAQGAKRWVCLDAAQQELAKIVQQLEDVTNPYGQLLMRGDPSPRILEEAEYGLARAYIENGKSTEAEAVLSRLIERNDQLAIQRGYYLSRAWHTQAKLAMGQREWDLALKFLQRADDAAKQVAVSMDYHLELWIDQSHCLRQMHRYDDALKVLSRVVNDETASSKRIEAMYLRAMIYASQGADDLAIRQLESTARKSGPWAVKAQETLRRDYGWQ